MRRGCATLLPLVGFLLLFKALPGQPLLAQPGPDGLLAELTLPFLLALLPELLRLLSDQLLPAALSVPFGAHTLDVARVQVHGTHARSLPGASRLTA